MKKVVWTEQAYYALQQTVHYISAHYGRKAAERLLKNAYHTGLLLGDNPYMGAIEPLMAQRAVTYRSIVVGRLNKIIYRIQDEHIEIADFWDVRREPETLSQQIK